MGKRILVKGKALAGEHDPGPPGSAPNPLPTRQTTLTEFTKRAQPQPPSPALSPAGEPADEQTLSEAPNADLLPVSSEFAAARA